MLRTPPFFPPNRGKTIFESTFLWRDFLNNNIQAKISALRLVIYFSERELKKALRDTYATRDLFDTCIVCAKDVLLVRSEHAYASYPGLSLYGAGRKESSGTGLEKGWFGQSKNSTLSKKIILLCVVSAFIFFILYAKLIRSLPGHY